MNKQTLNNQKPFTNTKLTTDTLSPARSSNSKCTKRKSTTTTKKKQKQCERKQEGEKECKKRKIKRFNSIQQKDKSKCTRDKGKYKVNK